MEDFRKTWGCMTKKDYAVVSKYKERLRELEEIDAYTKIVSRQTNSIDFYKITPKQQLPKFLQKQKFQTVHMKEKEISNVVKVFKKQNIRPEEKELRKKLKENGEIMLLSEIYEYLGEGGEPTRTNESFKINQQTNDLEEWEKHRKQFKHCLNKLSQIETKQEAANQHQLLGNRKKSIQNIAKQFKDGSDYKQEIERALEIIEMTHSSEYNLMNKYVLVENSSKLLKQELDHKKEQVESNIKARIKSLYEARIQYHNYFEEKNTLQSEQQPILSRDESIKDEHFRISNKSLSYIKAEKLFEQKNQKKYLLETIETKILKTKKKIQGLEESISNLEEQLRRILVAEKVYYKILLKHGNDVRESGLAWLIKKLQITEANMNQFQYPEYLDKKCKLFIVQKSLSEEEQESLQEQKIKFVNQIGKASAVVAQFRSKVVKEQSGEDRIVESELSEIPKKYRRSLRKLATLNEQFARNSSLLEVQQRKNGFEISSDLDGMSNKDVYKCIGERLKKLDLSKMKKDKACGKKSKLIEYQTLLEKITNIHIKLEEMDMQLETHLLSHYKQNQNLFFMQAAACFGYKKAYTMIIKHFSWKNYHQHLR